MTVQVGNILAENITVVYDRLDLRLVDATKLKALTEAQPVIMDTPDLIVAVYPPSPLLVHLGDRRLRVTHQGEHRDLGTMRLWEVAVKCHEIVPQESKVIAYGYNYDLVVSTRGLAASDALRTRFLRDQQAFEQAVGGTLRSFAPRFVYEDAALCDLTLEAVGAEQLKVHLNVHFVSDSLPPAELLQHSYAERFQRLTAVLPQLLQGGH
ncbi:MAG: hypothetical protein K6V36_12195 [Anaerolineae bacterium]|nr:hypothetical protein [Anaerolineae bacterium]